MYLGGKSKLAREIATAIAPRGKWWEPFCGGLSVSVELSKSGHRGIASDSCAPLIALYHAVARGWDPPSSLTREEYELARALPDSDPLKAFAGFGCSFGAKWFAGYDGERSVRTYKKQGEPKKTMVVDKPAACRRTLLRDVPIVSASAALAHWDFFDIDPGTTSPPECIYADPPYEGTTGYGAVEPFDHDRFWERCVAWADRGVRVFVSEACTPRRPCDVVLEKAHRQHMWSQGQKPLRIERLFYVRQSAGINSHKRKGAA